MKEMPSISRLLWIFGLLVLVCNPSYALTADPFHRTVRATSDEIGQWVERTSLVARVLNGIALQAGLMNKQIPVDEAVAELLNFGNVSLSQVSKIQSDKVTALTSLLKSSQGSLAATQEILDIEELTLVFIEIMKESESIGDIKSVPRIDEYFNSLESRNQLTLPVFDDVDKKFAEVLEDLETVSKISDYAAKKQSEKAVDFSTLCKTKEDGEKLQEYIGKTIAVVKDLEQRKVFADAVSIFQPIRTAVKLMALRSDLPDVTLTQDNKDEVTKQVEIMSKASTAAGEVALKLSMFRTIIEGRLFSQKQQRKWTDGLPGGVADLEKLAGDLKDPWLNQTLKSYGDLSKLRRGLQPIIQLQSEIKSLEDSFKSISTQEMRSSVKIFGNVLEKIAKLPAATTELSELLDEFGVCNRPPISDIAYIEAKEVIQNTEKLARSYQVIQNINLSGLEADLKSLDEFIGRVTPVTTTMNDEENGKLIEEMQKGDKWNVTALVKGIQMKYEALRDQKFEEIAGSLVQDKNRITDFQGKSEVADELALYECLRKSAGKSEKVSNAFQAVRILRFLDPKETDNVGKIASTIAKTSADFKKLKDLPESMRKRSTAETEPLNKMVDSMKHASTLGKAANGLRNAHQLGKMESSIALLKKENDHVSDQISSVESPVLKTHLGNVWKDHSAGIDSLETQFGKIGDIESKLSLANVTNLKKLGDSLKDLSSLSSVSWNVESDVDVVKSLIPLATDKTTLEAVAAELEKFEALNLDFSGFQGAFNTAPSTFTAVDTFVSGYLRGNLESSSLKSTSSDNSALITLIVCIVGAVLFLAILGAGFFFCVLPYIKTPSESDLQKWIRRQEYSTIAKAEKYHQKVYELMNNDAVIDKKASVAYLPVSKMRDPNVFCNPENAVKVKRNGKTIPIHANKITCPDGCVFIATQAPMDGKEPGKDDTLEDFIDMIMQQEAEFVVMLCNFEEGLFKCPEYIPPKGGSLEIGRYKLTNTWQMKMSVDGFRTSLKIEDKNGQIPARAIVHYQYIEWPDQWLPIMPHTCVAILKMVNKSKKPIIVHCSTGTGRSVSFIATEYISNAVATRATATIAKVMEKLKTFRWHGIQNWTQSYYTQICVEYKLCLDFDLNMDDYQKQFTMQRAMIDEAAEKDKDERKKSKMSAKSSPSTPTPKTPVTLKSKKSETDSDSRGGAGSDVSIQME